MDSISKFHMKNDNNLNEVHGQLLLDIARRTLIRFTTLHIVPDFSIDKPELNKQYGVFVTLKKGGELRGCIGQLASSDPVWKTVREQTIASASEDNRFPKVTISELSQITIELSILSPLKKIHAIEEIQLGKHGVLITKGLQSGVFLPQVAEETGWDRDTFLSNLCYQKAGLPPDCYKDPETEIYLFTVQKFEELDMN